MARVFISYRREDSIAYAGRLFDRLKAHFGEAHVFMDITSLKPGEDFADILQKTIESCDALVAVIGTQWLTAKMGDGRPRLDDSSDFVHFEIATALERGTRVIPVLVAGAQMPRASDLPDALQTLARRQALIVTDVDFDQSVTRLIQTLDAVPDPERQGRKRKKILATATAAAILAMVSVMVLRFQAKRELRSPKTLSSQSVRVNSVAYSPDGRLLAAAGDRGNVAIWDPTKGKLLRKYSVGNSDINSVAFRPDGRLLASGGSDHDVNLSDPTNGDVKITLSFHREAVMSVAFSPDGQELASASTDDTIEITDLAPRALPKQGSKGGMLTWHVDNVKSVLFSPNGHLLASGAYDGTLKIWNPDNGALFRTMSVQTLSQYVTHLECIAFRPNGKWLASGSYHGSVEIWEPANGRLLRTLAQNGNSRSINSVAFSPDGRWLAAAGDDYMIRLWDPANGKLLRILSGHEGNVESVAFSPDGVWLASGGDDGVVKLWHVPTLLSQ
jgi:uncharacterized protein with WD repeat